MRKAPTGRAVTPRGARGAIAGDLSTAGRGRRIGLLLESDGPGGAEYMLLHLAEALRRRGHRVVAVGPEDGSGWLGERFRSRGFEVATFLLRRPLDWRCLRGLVELVRDRELDVVHSHEFSLAVYGSAAAAITGRPHITTMHGGRYYARRFRRRLALRCAFEASEEVVAVSRSTRADLVRTLGVDPESVRVVPNGIPPRGGSGEGVRRELDLHPEEPLILSVGSLYPVKGHDVLIEAVAHLDRHDPDLPWRLAIAGTGEEEGGLRERIGSHGIHDRVHLLGFRDDVGDLLDAAQVFALPSRSEGLPLALLEAMHAEKAIVATRVGGIPEAVTAGREGLLVPPDDAGSLASGLGAVLRDPSLRRRLGQDAGLRARKEFSVRAMADAYERAYGWRPAEATPRPDRRSAQPTADSGSPEPARPHESAGPSEVRSRR